MSNELLIEKPWWKRNIIWLLLVVLVVGIVTTCSSLFLNGNLDFYALANADPSFYEVALDSANGNRAVVEKFGQLNPISRKEIYDGKAFYSNKKNSLNIILPVTGIKENGIMKLWRERNSAGWKYDSVVINSGDAKIIVIKSKSTSH